MINVLTFDGQTFEYPTATAFVIDDERQLHVTRPKGPGQGNVTLASFGVNGWMTVSRTEDEA